MLKGPKVVGALSEGAQGVYSPRAQNFLRSCS